jgi:hypothetical protein
MFCFGVISLPIGLWYQIRNIIRFGDNKAPVPPMTHSTEKYSIFQRFFTFNFSEAFHQGWNYYSHNLWGYIVKTSVYGEEGSLVKNDPFFYALMAINFLLIIISVFAVLRYLFKKGKTTEQTVLVYTFFIHILFIIAFYVAYPYICTMDFRYIAICLVPGIILLAQLLEKTKRNVIRIPIELLCYGFILLSIGMIFFY